MRVLLVHAVEEIVLLADRRLQVLAGDVLAVSVPQHFNHSRQRPHDVTFRLVGPAKETFESNESISQLVLTCSRASRNCSPAGTA